MIQLRTLGSVELTGPDPGAARVLRQPKRLAVLCYLAGRSEGEWLSRERIMATFWPELPTIRAQGNLRTVLHFLGKALGPELVERRGSSIRVSPERMRCDAAILLTEPAGRTDDVLRELYRGEFLDGLHLSASFDFDRWVDRTRAALRARASEVAWSLSQRAEANGEWISAARHGRQAVELAVDVEGAAQRLIRLLDRAGDRGAALDEYRRLTTTLEQEFGVPPSPESAALISQLRERRVAAAGVPTPEPARADRQDRYLSLAVLPFKNLGEQSVDDLASGLGEDLLTALSGIRDVRVTSRTTVRQFASQPPTSMRDVHEQLKVDLVLEGSVRLKRDRVRIAVQLTDTRRDEHLWAETYDRELTDLFEVQGDVALRIARALAAELSPREHQRLRQPPTTSVEAYRLYLRAREIWAHRRPDGAARAAGLFRRALDIAPDFPLAWVGLADAWLVRGATGEGTFAQMGREARATIDQALNRDPELGEARATLGLILTFVEWDLPGAEREYWRATELSPGYATAHQWYGQFLAALGKDERALAESHAALDLDPLSPAVNEGLGLVLYHLDRVDEATRQLRRTIERWPEFWRARLALALCHAAAGDEESCVGELLNAWSAGAYGAGRAEADEAAAKLSEGARPAIEYLLKCVRSRVGKISVIRVIEVVLLMLLERHEQALKGLEAAYEDGSLALVATMYAPVLDPLSGDPRFHALLDEAGLMLPRWKDA